jgi:cysteine desulfurase/selenocysteine lyase
MQPYKGGGDMILSVSFEKTTYAPIPAKFEAGTPPIVPAIGLGAAIDYLRGIGFERIHQHERLLAQAAHERLEAIGGVRFLGPAPELKAGIVSFTIEGVHAHDVAQLLDRQGVAVRAGHHCTMPLHKRLRVTSSSRASFYLYNTLEEVDTMAAALVDAKKIFQRR